MFAPTKRRHLSYYLSLPLVVAIAFFLVAQLAALQRAEIVAELADRVAHRETIEATAALRQLAGMPRPPLDVLVAAATSADYDIAHEAQRLISAMLRRWQRQIESQRSVSTVSRQLTELAASLAEVQARFSTADHRWLAGTSRRILRMANRISPQHSPLVAVHCDSILAAITASEMSERLLVDRDLAAGGQPLVTAVSAPAVPANVAAMSSANVGGLSGHNVRGVSDADFVRLSKAPSASETPPTASPAGQPAGTLSDNRLRDSATSGSLGSTSPATQVERAWPSDELDPADDLTDDDSAEYPSVGAAISPWRAEWSHPMLRSLPAMPISSRRAWQDDDPAIDHWPPSESIAASDDRRPALADADSRELLERWLVASGSDVLPLENELTRRGFGRLSARLVQQLFSDDAEVRLRLVDDVLTEPGVDARPWLILLADDSDADVRLLVVTIMATSDDARLIEKAWQVAISDRDPRIAGLASRLRDRRESAQRR